MIDGDIEEAGDLLGMDIDGQHAIDAGGGEQIGHELGGDGDARLVLAILAGVPEERDHGRDAVGAGAARGIHHDQELHEVLIRGGAGGLDDEDIAAPDVFVDADESLAVGEGADRRIAQRNLDKIGDVLGQRHVCRTGKYLQFWN